MDSLRERIISAAYPLFVQRGIRDVSLEDIRRAAGVSATDLHREFPNRDSLALQCLALREEQWTLGVVETGARSRATTPDGQLLAIFDVFDDWFHRDDYEACTFINVLLEMGPEHPLGHASAAHLQHIRELVETLANEAGLVDPKGFALSWHILMKGSIINAVEGDSDAARRARTMGQDLIARHRPTAVPHRRSPDGMDRVDRIRSTPTPAARSTSDPQRAAASTALQERLLELIARHRATYSSPTLSDEDVDWFAQHVASTEPSSAPDTTAHQAGATSGGASTSPEHRPPHRLDPRWAVD